MICTSKAPRESPEQAGLGGKPPLLKRLANSTWLWLAVLLPAVGALYWFFGCPIKHFTGLSCPGCGMTRALLYAVQGRWAAAFYYHPLFFLLPFLAFLLLAKWARRHPALRSTGLIIIGAVFLGVYIWRLFAFPHLVNYTPRWPVDVLLRVLGKR